MGIFSKDSLNSILNTAKDVAKNTTEKASKTFSESAEQIKKFSEDSKALKAPIEGGIARYAVTYKGGLSEYPKQKIGEIGLNIMSDCFIFKPTSTAEEWFKEMSIPYERISKLEIVERKVSNTEWLLSSSNSDMKAMEQKNNIEITYEENGQSLFVRFEMLTGISIFGQAKKCVEFMDVLRQNGILNYFSGNENVQKGNQVQETDILSQIEKLSKLKNEGILTDDEFMNKKKELLDRL